MSFGFAGGALPPDKPLAARPRCLLLYGLPDRPVGSRPPLALVDDARGGPGSGCYNGCLCAGIAMPVGACATPPPVADRAEPAVLLQRRTATGAFITQSRLFM